ncbi:sulfite exporter TauE/SafE family protein [Providencia heimbachae]|uniref:Probable membrane transporter protein n=1 Tax=Providencia heimbachae ATCC 35613 TaxID=1354272 RepID=A0A1B7JZ40_9GAMM|nr:sulfite exporter TauE/SafE family protein [Providencia heimbachae]OAT53171.1 integral membrane protein [Providencia heimbachae ATCC 35613]SQH14207.1 Sulfite exporter TauE/SafE [Providencia heimbachae]
MDLLLGLFGFISGITTALFGFGGGFITVPLLYALITVVWGPRSNAGDVAMQIAVATSTCVMIFSSTLSSRAHYLKGNLSWKIIRPFIIPISLGGIAGAFVALSVESEWIRWIFIGYLVVTILDCFIRPGFMTTDPNGIAPSKGGIFADTPIGVVIGAVAAFLGVGGSVMTVPLMRRRGASMIQAAAFANPLTLPMAITGTLTYFYFAVAKHLELGAGFIGMIYIKGALILIASSWLGIRFAAVLMPYLSDKRHAQSYPILLMIVLCVMLLV